MSETPLHRVRVVLVEPIDLVNIAAAVRAMKNMGVRDLVLVNPAEYDAWRIEGIAHDTADILERVVLVDSIDAALADTVFVAAFTARGRSAKWAQATPREAATTLVERTGGGAAAMLFGREDRGLPNEALDRAHVHVTIPTTDHASLNLAQAVMVALYELHLAAGDATRALKPPRKDAPVAEGEQLERYFTDAERALESIDFFKTRNREHILRAVRSLTFRAQPDAREIQLLRAMALEVVKTLERVRLALLRDPTA